MSKALSRTFRLLVFLVIGVGACGGGGKGSGNYPDASTFGSGGTSGSGASTGAAGGTGTGNTVGATGGSGTSTGGSGTATGGTGGTIVFPGSGGSGTSAGGASGVPPASGSTLLVPGPAILMGPGSPCSSAPATTTPAPDQWCGAFVPGGNQGIGLIVFNVTKALAGAAITCSTTDTNCVALNAAIDTTDSDVVISFFGQTLIYYDASNAYGWRPGWTAGRAIAAHSASQLVQCVGNQDDALTAICVSQAAVAYAGTIDTQTGSTLPMLDTLGNGSTGIAFSPDGKSAIWSVNTSTTNPAETLKMQTIGDATTKKTIATSVTGWSVSADSTRWYWMSAPTVTDMITSGTLQTAPYPAGTAPATVQSKVYQYAPYGTKGVVTMANPAAATGTDLDVITDIANPTTTTATLEAADVIALVSLDDAGTVLYATMEDQPDATSSNVLVDLHVIKADATGKCVVSATPAADPGASFNQSTSAVEWVQVTLDSSANVTAVSGQFTTLADCAPHPFSTTLYSFYDVASGLLIEQNLDSNAATIDIDYAPFAGTGVPGAATPVQKGADTTIQPLFPSPGRVLFSLLSGASTDGIYASPALATAATPYVAPLARPLASSSAASRLSTARGTTAQQAQARFAAATRPAIPRLIAAPTPAVRPLSTKPTLVPFARDIHTANLVRGDGGRLRPFARAATTR